MHDEAVDQLHQACTFIKTENIAVNEIGRIICSHILLHAQYFLYKIIMHA